MKSKSHSHVGYLIASILFIGAGIWFSVDHLVSDKNEQYSKAHDEKEPSRMVDAGSIDAGTQDTTALPETISKAEVSTVMEKYVDPIKQCIRKQLEKDPLVTGTMLVSFTIGGNGSVDEVRILTKEHQGTYVSKCVIEVINNMEFPKFSGEPIVIKRIPLRLDEQAIGTYRGGRIIIEDEHIDGNDTSATPDETLPPLTNADILGELRKNLSGFKKCIRERKKAGASVEGRLVVTFTINPSGRVKDVQVSTAQFKDTDIGKCISGIIAQLKFPEFSGEAKKVSFPFAVY